MAFAKKSTKILFLLAIFNSGAFANLDCGGKPFLCVNSTHFHVCVDLGNSVSFTVDNFIIPCPPGTECSAKNHFECEIPAPTIPAAILSTNHITNDGKAKEERSVSTTTIWDVVTTTVPVSSVNEAEYSEKYSNTDNLSSLFNSATIGQSQSSTIMPTKSIVLSEITNNGFPTGETINDKINFPLDNDTTARSFRLPPILVNDTGPLEYSLTSATTTDGITSTVKPVLFSDTTESYIPNEISADVSNKTFPPLSETITQSDKPASTSTADPTADFIGLKLSPENALLYDHLSNTTESLTKKTIEDIPILTVSATKETVQDIITSTENTTELNIQNTYMGKAIIQDTATPREYVVKTTIQDITKFTESAKRTSIAESANTQDFTTESMHIVTQTPAESLDFNLDTISNVLSSVPTSKEPVLITFKPQNSSGPVETGILPVDYPTMLNATDASALTALKFSSNKNEPSSTTWLNLDEAITTTINSPETTNTNSTNGITENYTSVEGEHANHIVSAQESSTHAPKLYDATQLEAIETSTKNAKIENNSMKPAFEITTENSQQREVTFNLAKSDAVRREETMSIAPILETTTENAQQYTESTSIRETPLQNPLEKVIFNVENNYSQGRNNNLNNNSNPDTANITNNEYNLDTTEISNIVKKTLEDVKQDESTAKVRITTQNEDEIKNINGYDTTNSQSRVINPPEVTTFSIQNTVLQSTETSTTLSKGILEQAISGDFSNAALTQEAPPKHDEISQGTTDTPLNIKHVIGGKLPWQGPKDQSMVESLDQMYEVPTDGGVNKKESELGLSENSAFENLSTTKPLKMSTTGIDKTGPRATSLGLDFKETTTSTVPTIKVTTDSIVIIDSTHTYTVKVSVDKNINNQENNVANGNLLSKLSEAIRREQLHSDADIVPITLPTHTIKPTVEQSDTDKTGINLLSPPKLTTNQEQTNLPAIVKTISENENIQINPNPIGQIYTSSPSQIIVPISTKPSIETTTSTTLGPNVITTSGASTTHEDIFVTQSMLSFAASIDGLYSNGEGMLLTSGSTETAISASIDKSAKENEEDTKLNVDSKSTRQSIDVTTMTTTTMGDIVAIEPLTATLESIQVPKVTPLEVSLVSPTLLSDGGDVFSTTESIITTSKSPASQKIVSNENRNTDELWQQQQIIDSVTTQQSEDKVLLASATTSSTVVITEAFTTSTEPIQVRLFTPSDINPVVVSSSFSVITTESPVSPRIVANEDAMKSVDELTTQQGNDKVLTMTLRPIAVTEASERLQVTKSMLYEVGLDIIPSSSMGVISEDVSSTTKTTLESPEPPGIVTNENGKQGDALTTQIVDDKVLIATPMPSSSIIATEASTTASETIQVTSFAPLKVNPDVSPLSDSAYRNEAVSSTTEHIKTISESSASQKIMANKDTLQSDDDFTNHQGIEVLTNKTNAYPTSIVVTKSLSSQVNSNLQPLVSSTTDNANQESITSQGVIEPTALTNSRNEKEERLSIVESSISSTNEEVNQNKTSTYQGVSYVGNQQGVTKSMAPTSSENEKGERLFIATSSGTPPNVISFSSSLISSPASLNEHSTVTQTAIHVNTPMNSKEAKADTDNYGIVEPVLNTSTGKERVQTKPSNSSIKTVPDEIESEKDAEEKIYREATQKSTTGNSRAEITTTEPILVNTTVTSTVSEANTSINVTNNKDTQTPEVSPKATTTKPSQVKNSSASNNPTFICTNLPRGRYSDENDCRKFYICVDKPDPIVGHCPINTVFSEIKKQCVRNLSHCIRGDEFKCSAHGRFVDYHRENIYYVCIRSVNIFLRFKFQCQAGYTLDRAAVRCKHRVDSQIDSVSTSDTVHNKDKSQWTKSANGSSSSSSKKSSKDVGNAENEFTCKKVGKFPHQSDSKKYYICYKTKKSDLKKKIGKCDSDEQFDPDKKKCIEDEE